MPAAVVTIFGGSGFIGRYLVKRLAARGWVIRVASRSPRHAKFLQPLGDVGQITPVRAVVQDQAAVERAVEGADTVVNLVGLLYETGRQTFEAVHAEAGERIAKAAQAAGVESFIQMSAIGADEGAEADYARTKGQAEAAVRAILPQAVIVRPSLVIGPEDGFFNRFASMAQLSPFLPLVGGGTTRFQPVFVGDVADALVAALTRPECRGRTFELGGPEVYSFKQLLELMLREIRRKRLLLPLPFALAQLQATVLELLPVPPLTRDQLRMLRHDNVVSADAAGLQDLGIEPTNIELVIPAYLDRYRPGGRFSSNDQRQAP